MRRLALIGTTAIAAAVLSAAPISVNWSAGKNLSVSQDKAFAVYGRPATPASVAGVTENMCDGKFGGTTTSHRSPFLGHLTCLLSSFRLGQGQFCGLFLGSR